MCNKVCGRKAQGTEKKWLKRPQCEEAPHTQSCATSASGPELRVQCLLEHILQDGHILHVA